MCEIDFVKEKKKRAKKNTEKKLYCVEEKKGENPSIAKKDGKSSKIFRKNCPAKPEGGRRKCGIRADYA